MIADHFRHLFQDYIGLRRQVEELTEGGKDLSCTELKDRCVNLCADFDDHLDRTNAFLMTLNDGEDVDELKRAFNEDRAAIAEEFEVVRKLNHQAKTFYDEALRRMKAIDTKVNFVRSRISEHRGKLLSLQLEQLEAEVRKGLGGSSPDAKN